MNLFFETSHQAWSFLGAVPAGLLAALCLDAGIEKGICRFLLDLLLLLTTGSAAVAMVSLFHDHTLRLYHLLGMTMGVLLYLQGLFHLKILLVRKMKEKRNRKQEAKKESGK